MKYKVTSKCFSARHMFASYGKIAIFSSSTLAVFNSTIAYAGGFVAPIVESAPINLPTAVAPQSYWMALIPIGLLLLLKNGNHHNKELTPVPKNHGGNCFGEGTLILLKRGWASVENVKVGDSIATSKGFQEILSVGSWQPVEFQDRPVMIGGVRLSHNHGVAVGNFRVEAQLVSSLRLRIDGRRYFHFLVTNHSWLFAKSDKSETEVKAESMLLTNDMELSKIFPHLVALHATYPVSLKKLSLDECSLQATI
ncbi:hypothetical protein [Paracoccus sp. JM45]|uniref:hypothetical protein n=1 Tax=Paracoccus sp. JM45 TaxID=2283626 RepID=UPI0011C3EB3E|nr:hypothetical protein [Paracoccus sp. JM45]